MSKKKLLIREVFEKVRIESPKDTKSGWADDLSDNLEKKFNFIISGKTLSRYYDSFVAETRKETGIETIILDKLSQYMGYQSFSDFNPTFEKNIENEEAESTTSVKFLLDGEEVSVPEKIFNIIIKITNNPNFNVPDFMKKNGLGVLEFVFVVLLVTGGVVFSNPIGKNKGNSSFGFLNPIAETNKKYMYWDGEQFNPTDSSYIGPEFEVVAIDEKLVKHFKRITRKDTMTVENSLGRTWYSKYYGNVEFFTADGTDPDNNRELRKSSATIIEKYAGKNADSIQAE